MKTSMLRALFGESRTDLVQRLGDEQKNAVRAVEEKHASYQRVLQTSIGTYLTDVLKREAEQNVDCNKLSDGRTVDGVGPIYVFGGLQGKHDETYVIAVEIVDEKTLRGGIRLMRHGKEMVVGSMPIVDARINLGTEQPFSLHYGAYGEDKQYALDQFPEFGRDLQTAVREYRMFSRD